MAEQETIEGFVDHIIFRNPDNGYTVMNVRTKQKTFTAVGETFDLAEGEYIEGVGQWVVHPVYDKQFKLAAYQTKIPADTDSVKKYLASGAIKGIGPKMAERIVKKFGVDTLHVLESEPERLSEVRGISEGKAITISQQVLEKRQMRSVMMGLAKYGIGMKLATEVYRRYGEKTLDIIQDNPYKLAEDIRGIGFGTADEIARKTGIELTSSFRVRAGILYALETAAGDGHVFLPERVLKSRAEAILQLDLQEFDNELAGLSAAGKVTLKRAQLQTVSESEKIQKNQDVSVSQSLEESQENQDTQVPQELEKFQEEQDTQVPQEDLLTGNGASSETEEVRVYLPRLYRAESDTASRLTAMNRFQEEPFEEEVIRGKIREITERIGVEPDQVQEDAVLTAVTNPVVIITGGPGTGKTTIIRTIISYFEAEQQSVELAAPTGRAAKRMSEATGRPAQTIHRLLGAQGMNETSGRRASGDDGHGGQIRIGGLDGSGDAVDGQDRAENGDGGRSERSSSGERHLSNSLIFTRDEDDPIDTDVLIIDESSMVDIYLMRALLTATRPGTRLILVGDTDQLPSVGPGNVLHDIIDSGVFPVVKLTKVFRQAAESDIVMNAHRINRGEPVTLTTRSRDFLYIDRETPEQIIRAIYSLVTDKLPKYVNGEPQDIQILTPSRKTALGVENLNRIMQQIINPAAKDKPEKKIGDTTFRLGDKVMQTKNDYAKEWTKKSESGLSDEEGTGVYNGDTGIITKFSSTFNTLTIQYDDGREAEYTFDELNELDLAYAMTIHKSQGSEYKAIVMPLYPGPPMLLNRNLLYTAVTRAKNCVVLVGHADIFEQMEKNYRAARRFSSLAEQLRTAAFL